jgi:hypothetical protein
MDCDAAITMLRNDRMQMAKQNQQDMTLMSTWLRSSCPMPACHLSLGTSLRNRSGTLSLTDPLRSPLHFAAAAG